MQHTAAPELRPYSHAAHLLDPDVLLEGLQVTPIAWHTQGLQEKQVRQVQPPLRAHLRLDLCTTAYGTGEASGTIQGNNQQPPLGTSASGTAASPL